MYIYNHPLILFYYFFHSKNNIEFSTVQILIPGFIKTRFLHWKFNTC